MKIWPFDPFARESHGGQYLSDRGPGRKGSRRCGRYGSGWATGWGSRSSCTASGTCPARCRSPGRWSHSRRSGWRRPSRRRASRPRPSSPAPPRSPVVSGERPGHPLHVPGAAGDGRGAHRQPGPDVDRRAGGAEADRDHGGGVPAAAQAPQRRRARCTTCATAHVAANVPSLYLMETIRYNYRHVFPQLVEGLPPVVRGGDGVARLSAAPTGPGLGISLRPEIGEAPRGGAPVVTEKGERGWDARGAQSEAAGGGGETLGGALSPGLAGDRGWGRQCRPLEGKVVARHRGWRRGSGGPAPWPSPAPGRGWRWTRAARGRRRRRRSGNDRSRGRRGGRRCLAGGCIPAREVAAPGAGDGGVAGGAWTSWSTTPGRPSLRPLPTIWTPSPRRPGTPSSTSTSRPPSSSPARWPPTCAGPGAGASSTWRPSPACARWAAPSPTAPPRPRRVS